MRGLDEKALDEEHSASEIIHTIISNLFLLNSGGIAAIPAISGFFGEKYFFGHDLVELFWRPGISFVLGEVLVLLCPVYPGSDRSREPTRSAEDDKE